MGGKEATLAQRFFDGQGRIPLKRGKGFLGASRTVAVG
jgi:hypothetical protein